MSQTEIIRVENLKKYFPVEKSFLEKLLSRSRSFIRAVDDVTFSVLRGEVFHARRGKRVWKNDHRENYSRASSAYVWKSVFRRS